MELAHLIQRADIQRRWYEWRRDVRLSLRFYDKLRIRSESKIIGFSHHKCATKSTGLILEAISDKKNLNCYWGYQLLSRQNLDKLRSQYQIIFFHRITPDECPVSLEGFDFRGFHIIRDPRAILISQYFSHRDTHELNEYTDDIEKDRKFLKLHTLEEGLLYILHHSERFIETMGVFERWNFIDQRILELRFEDFISEPRRNWELLLNFVDLHLENSELDCILNRYSFTNLQKRSAKVSGNSHYRSGKSNGYEGYFSHVVKREFKEKYGQLLIKLGYETSNDW